MSAIPFDVVEQILAYLDEDDLQTLRASSLVCKSWIHPSQRLIFKKFDLNQHVYLSDRTKCTPPASVFTDSPHLAVYVRRVEIRVGRTSECDPLVASLLRMFTSTRSLLFRSDRIAMWKNLPIEVHRSVETIISLPTFERLDLASWVFYYPQFSNLLRHCSPTLRSLCLWTVISVGGEGTIAVELPWLKEIIGNPAVPDCGTLKLPNVDVVELTLHTNRCSNASQCRAVLDPSNIPSNASMWSFHILLCRCLRYEACNAVNFDTLVNLRHLRFRMSVDDQVSPASSVPAFGRILLKIPTSRLESFRIHFICNTELMDLGEAGWGQMADSLKPFLDASKLLNRVTFVVEDRHMYGRCSTAVAVMGDQLKYLKSRLLIEVYEGRINRSGWWTPE